MLKEWLQKITDVIMPLEPLPEEVPEKKVEVQPVEVAQAQAKVQAQPARKAATGGGAAYMSTSQSGTTSVNGVRYTAYTDTTKVEKPAVEGPRFDVKIYKPADYNQVAGITDDVLIQKAVVVNYEHVNLEEQQRICDFIDGACYAVDATVTRISDRIYLYAPAGIDAGDLAALTAQPSRYR